MPVLLTEVAEFETWLTGSPEEAFGRVRSFDPASMQIVQSGMEKQDRVGIRWIDRFANRRG